MGWACTVDIAVAKLKVFFTSQPSTPEVEVGKTRTSELQLGGGGGGLIKETMKVGVQVSHVDIEKGLRRSAVFSKTGGHTGMHKSTA